MNEVEIIYSEVYQTDAPGLQRSVVLARRKTENGIRFIAGECVTSGETPAYFWGCYRDTEKEARADYHRRLLRHYE